MAEVFKCRLSGIGGFNKLVVVKRIRPELASDPSFLDMFLDEARIAANLAHPNVVQIFEIDQAGGLPYIAMEYVRGPTLSLINREERRRRTQNCGAAARIMAGICAGLHYAHEAADERGAPLGIVHRDVSPQNIIVSMEGVPKLLDFGVAKARNQLAHTGVGGLKGKLKFMAPEQFITGAPLTAAVDLFAAGVCLYEATTLTLPYGGQTEMEVMRAAAAGKFLKPSEVVPGFDPRLEELILWAMEPKLSDRCPDAKLWGEALEDYADRVRCTQADVARYLKSLFPNGTGEVKLKSAYVDVDSDDILGPPGDSKPKQTPMAEVTAGRRTLELRVVRPEKIELDESVALDIEVEGMRDPLLALEPRRRRDHRVSLWGAAFTVAAIALFAMGLALRRAKTPSLALAQVAAAEAPDAGRAVAHQSEPLLKAARKALDKGAYVEAAELARRVLAEELNEPKASALLLEATARERAAKAREAEKESVPKPPPPRPVPPPPKATLSVETNPLAQVFLNGKLLGWSPIQGLVLAPGVYRLRAQHARRQALERELRVVAGRELSVNLELPELPKPRPPEPAPTPASAPAPVAAPPPAVVAHEAPPAPPVVESLRTPLRERAQVRRETVEPTPSVAAPAPAGFTVECPDGSKLVRASVDEMWCEAAGEREGPYLRLWANGRKAVQGEFRRGKKHGRWLEYYEQGGERGRVEWRRGVQLW